jgi:hypothetical protein
MDPTPHPARSLDPAGIFLVLITVLVFLLPILALFPPVPPSPSDAVAQTHLKLGLDRPKSNLRKATPRHSPPTTIQSLWIYPVKSCAGIELSRSRVVPQGLEFDRLFTFAQLKSPFPVSAVGEAGEDGVHAWQFITQRQFPLLATVRVELYVPDATGKGAADGGSKEEAFIILRFPWRERGWAGVAGLLAAKLRGGLWARAEKEVLLPVGFPSREEIAARGYEWEKVTIWKDTVEALNVGVEVPEELRLYLGVSNKLGMFRVDPGKLREVRRCAPRRDEAGYQPVTGFQDAYPLHMINVSSVKDLETKVGKDEELKSLDVRRFRANIIGESSLRPDDKIEI